MTKKEAINEAATGALRLARALNEPLHAAGIGVECVPTSRHLSDVYTPCLKLVVKDEAMVARLKEEFGDEIEKIVDFGTSGTIKIESYE